MDKLDHYRPNSTNDTSTNNTNITQSPTTTGEIPEFTVDVLYQVIAYCGLFVIGATGNLTVMITLFRGRHRKSRISLLIMHLAIADLIVTFIMMPLEIAWRITVQWTAGNALCKVFAFWRAFGLYLSSNVLVCVSVDRYIAILHPLSVTDARRRGKVMLIVAWTFACLFASPQCFVFHLAHHPHDPNFVQCVTFDFFSSPTHEIAYNVFCVTVMYFIPLAVIIFTYSRILLEISSKSRETKEDNKDTPGWDSNGRGRMRLRRSDMTNIERARSRTLRMTLSIVAAFIFCWTPYVVITLWYMFHRESAMKLNSHVQAALFIMAVSNSCMNPIVYGSFTMNLQKKCPCLRPKYNSHINLNRRSTNENGYPHTMLRSKQDKVPHLEARTTATTIRTTAFQTTKRSRFTFSRNSIYENNKVGRPHSDVCLPVDNDSGVSFSYRTGRAYHSEPVQQCETYERESYRTDSQDGIGQNHSSGSITTTIRESTPNGRITNLTISNLAYLKHAK